MPQRIRNLRITISLALLPLAMPVRACCDDAWSCIAAFATGGLSCAIENLVNSVRSMNQNVDNLVRTLAQQASDIVNLARNELGGAANDLRNLASQAESDVNGAIHLAQTIVDEESKPMTMKVAPTAPAARGAATETSSRSSPMRISSSKARASSRPSGPWTAFPSAFSRSSWPSPTRWCSTPVG